MSRADDTDLCARCGNCFPPSQVCGPCVTDAERVRSAAAVLRQRMKARGREPFITSVIVRALEKWADREDAAPRPAGLSHAVAE